MKQNFIVNATERGDMGKGASRRLRHADKVPGIVYGGDKSPISITVEHKDLKKLLENEAFYTQILNLEIDDKKESVILRDLQRHPFKARILHLDLQRVSDKEAIVMNIPLHFVGAEVSPGAKLSSGLVSHLESNVEVRCLPKDLPEFIEVDLSKIDINQSVHLSDLKLAENIELVALSHDDDKAVANMYVQRVATADEETVAPTASEVPVAGDENKDKEEEAPAEKGKSDK